jgi:hypothetical protein
MDHLILFRNRSPHRSCKDVGAPCHREREANTAFENRTMHQVTDDAT